MSSSNKRRSTRHIYYIRSKVLNISSAGKTWVGTPRVDFTSQFGQPRNSARCSQANGEADDRNEGWPHRGRLAT